MSTDVTAPARGLTVAEAAQRLAVDGPNAVAAPPPRRLVARIGRQLADPLVVLLLAAAVITAVLRDLPDTAVIALVVTVNTIIGVIQEVRADRAIAALDQLAAPLARVVRDGADRLLPTADVVRDDLVRLAAGDIVPADLRLVDAHRATFDESALTGESVPVTRTAGEDASAGTVLTTGRADGVVVGTGAASSLGRIADLVRRTRPGPTPLQRRLATLSRTLGGLTTIAVAAVVFAAGMLAGQPLIRMAITAVSLVVAAVPESLPAVVTLALALGARRMARNSAIPRQLHAVETLGSVTVIASDKTGTLTQNRMTVQQATTPDGAQYAITGDGYAPTGELRQDDTRMPASDAVRELARAGLLCNDATLLPPDDDRTEWAATGDPMEAALLTFAGRCGLDPDIERAAAPRIAEQPFDQSLRRMTTVHRQPDQHHLVVRKGAPEAILDPDLDRGLLAAAAEHAADGLRVLAIATAVTDTPPDPANPPPLHASGIVAIGDPLRDTARATAAAFDQAGVRLILITGDHPATAAAIGRRLGILADREPAAGPDTPDNNARVYARTRPEHKLDIIANLQHRGEIVAMTGDGVNDAPALRRADIGVAMGGGTEVARQAADLVLVDDNLATVARAIGEGRRIYDNIRRFLRYALSGGVAELLIMLAGPLLGMPLALLPAQLLWVNLLTHGIPGVALGAEPAETDVLHRPPRSPQESVLGDGLLRSVLLGGLCLATVVLTAGATARLLDRPWQSVMFVVLGLAQLGVALAVRAVPVPGTPRNWSLLGAVALSGLLQVAGVLLPPLRALLGTNPLTGPELLACAAIATVPGLALHLIQRAARRDLGPVVNGRLGPGANGGITASSEADKSLREDIMTTIGRGTAAHLEKVEAPGSMLTKTAAKALAVFRISLGFVFLWAFLDKTFGFGYATPAARSWINGGSPTKGFLSSVDVGPFQGFFHSIAGTWWANGLFMLGLLGIGLALILGIGMRLAAGAATLLMAFMWIAEFPLAQHTSAGKPSMSSNPITDYHFLYAVGAIALALTYAGHTWGLGRWWTGLPFVQKNRWLI